MGDGCTAVNADRLVHAGCEVCSDHYRVVWGEDMTEHLQRPEVGLPGATQYERLNQAFRTGVSTFAGTRDEKLRVPETRPLDHVPHGQQLAACGPAVEFGLAGPGTLLVRARLAP